MTNNIVSGNTCSNSASYAAGNGTGGGIYAKQSILSGNEITSNTTVGKFGYGGGIYAEGSTISGNTIDGNTTNSRNTDQISRGGGIYILSGTISDNLINNNTVSGGSDQQGSSLRLLEHNQL